MRSRKKISKNVSYTEATKSNTAIKYGINNEPEELQLQRMQLVAEEIFQKVRNHFGVPISVTSFYRSPELNSKLGGAAKSQHVKGEAMDLDADVYGLLTNKEIFDYIYNNLDYDQLIWEFGDDKEPAWIHVSYTDGCNRNEALVAYKEANSLGFLRTKYKPYED